MAEQDFTVAGMTCGHCVAAVSGELESVEGVRSVRVELATGRVTIESEVPIDPSLVRSAVDEAGYELVG